MQTILSIHSHVAFGHAGSCAADFPLQRLGFGVVAVDAVQITRYSGDGTWTGRVFAPQPLAEILPGQDACDAVLSGLLSDTELGAVVADSVIRTRQQRPGALYCCDPVMGDIGRGFQVKAGVPDFIRSRLVPLADILTPNQFELEFITGGPVQTLNQAQKAAATARRLGPKLLLLTSLSIPETPADSIDMLIDCAEGCWLVSTPRLQFERLPRGAGDCVAALFLAHYLRCGDPAEALAGTAAGIFAVMEATRAAGTRELRLIDARDQLITPRRRFPLERLR
ncbi:MAG: pyridoxal kinase PdxY [Rhodospirillaceae bacterium]